eukprot:SAG31_NODE_42956_length_269_cov_0.688235_1_plen_23_part_10
MLADPGRNLFFFKKKLYGGDSHF